MDAPQSGELRGRGAVSDDWTPDEATRHIEQLRLLAVEHERAAAALRWALGILDGDSVGGSPLPPDDDAATR